MVELKLNSHAGLSIIARAILSGDDMAQAAALEYRAFISYSHADTRWAKWLHSGLESFRIDSDLVGRETAMGEVPKTLRPIFRDRDDFTAGHSLTEQTLAALDAAAALIVICSPDAAASHYVNEEIRLFKSRHPDRPVIPLIVAGKPDEPDLECFPQALKFKLDADGQIVGEAAELLAADVREEGDGKHLAMAKVVAGLLGVSSDQIFRRAERERRRRARLKGGVAAAFVILVAVAGAFAFFDYQKRQTLADIEALVAKYSIVSTAEAAVPGAKQSLTQAITSIAQGASQDLRYAKALALLKEGKPREAEPLLAAVFEDKKKLAAKRNTEAAEAARNLASIAGISDLKKARKYYAEAAALDPENLYGMLQHATSESLGGSLDESESAFRRAIELAEARQDDASLQWAHWGLGTIRLARDDLTEALTELDTAEKIAQRHASADPENTEWQGKLAMSRKGVGDVFKTQGKFNEALKAYRESFAIYARLAENDPGNAVWDMDKVLSYQSIGDVLLKQGNPVDALASYQESLIIIERRMEADPDNDGWNLNKAMALKAIGDVRKAQGDVAGALRAYGDNLAIYKQRTEADPSSILWKAGLGAALFTIGDVMREQGRLDEALNAYRLALAISKREAEADPNTAAWQNSFLWAYVKIGDVLVKQDKLDEALSFYEDSLESFQSMSQADPGNAARKSNLAVAYERIGDVLKAQGRLEEALDSQRSGLAIREELARAYPDVMGWQRDLSISQERIGDILLDLDRVPEATAAFEKRLAIAEQLAGKDPSNTLWQSDLAISHGRVALGRSRQGETRQALEGFRKARDIIARLRKQSPNDASLPSLEWYDAQIAKMGAAGAAAPENAP